MFMPRRNHQPNPIATHSDICAGVKAANRNATNANTNRVAYHQLGCMVVWSAD